jgi:putative hydrolase of HD superfamily
MEKIDEIRKTLDFYVKANNLKTTISDKQNNYSLADNLFGSMILAIAINSEFKETNNFGKICRMLFLDEFSKLFPDYDFKALKSGKQFMKELNEVRSMQTIEAKLALKYKSLDFLLTKLITEKSNTLKNSELLEEACKIISASCGEDPSKCDEIFNFYYYNYRLKNKVRSGWDKNHWNVKSNRLERISEHIVGTIALALVISSEFEYNFDIDKVLKMLAIHETGETIIADITPFDGITPEEKEKIEHQAMIDALGGLFDKDELLSILYEFDEHKTAEAKFSYFCDKIEADLQAKIYQDKNMQHSLDDQANNCTFASSKIQKMLADGAKTAFDIWYGWDKNKYEGDKQYPDFSNILKIAKDNNLTQLTSKVIKEKIELTEEEHYFLSGKIAETIKVLYEDENIDSIYITNYHSSNGKGILNIVVLLNQESDYIHYDILMDKINSKIGNENNTNIKVLFNYDYSNRYSLDSRNPNVVHRVEQLAESSIVFDKTGNITKLKEAMKEYEHLYSFYLTDYVPPIDDEVSSYFNR